MAIIQNRSGRPQSASAPSEQSGTPFSDTGKTAFVFSGLGHFSQGLSAFEVLQEIPFFKSFTNPLTTAVGGLSPKPHPEDLLGHRVCTLLQYGLAALLMEMGVHPDGVIGHSAGEVAAALTAGLITEADAARLVHAHEAVMAKSLGKGRMLVAGLDPESAASEIAGNAGIWLSVVNSPQSVVFTGGQSPDKPGAIDELEEKLAAAGVFLHRLDPEIPFHSPLLDPFMPEFQKSLEAPATRPAKMTCWSSLLAGPLREEEATPAFWARHISQPVAFAPCFAAMIAAGYRTFIEIAPRPTLSLAMAQGADRVKAPVHIVETLKGENDLSALCQGMLSRLRGSGLEPDTTVWGENIAGENCAYDWPRDRERVAEKVSVCLAEATDGRIPDSSAARDGFFSAGMSSLMALRFRDLLEKRLGMSMPLPLLLDCPTPERLLDALCSPEKEAPQPPSPASRAPEDEDAIAIVGMGCRFPGGCHTPGHYWDKLVSGTHCFHPLPENRFDAGHLAGKGDGEIFFPSAAALLAGESIWSFDPGFFRLPETEALAMDPQHRLLLETLVEALEDGGIAREALAGTQTGVFVGMSTDDHKGTHIAGTAPGDMNPYAATGALFSTAAGRIAHWLDLHGPVMSLDTACSSALVAVHQAVRSLLGGEADLALACGVNAILSPHFFACLDEMGILSRSGDCRVFDAAADGYVRGEGCGVVVLKRLSHALKDGDPVRAVIRGSAVNHDGRSSSLTAPNGKAQEAVIRRALSQAGLQPEAVCMVEAHGTGTAMGDPVEMAALGRVFGNNRKDPLWVGSAKSVVGHLEPAAGMAGLFKTVLCLEKKQIPPQRGFEQPNPHLDLSGPLAIPEKTVPIHSETPPVAGVSSFGFSGTNAHILVAAAPVSGAATPLPAVWRVLPLSAHNPEALQKRMAELASWLDANPGGVDALCRTFSLGRWKHACRTAVRGSDAASLSRALRAASADPTINPDAAKPAPARRPRMGFLFSGQASQMRAMGESLYYSSGAFRNVMDMADTVCAPFFDAPLSAYIYGEKANAGTLQETRVAQPALFAVAMGMAAHWARLGLFPDRVMGHSLGELMAACHAGVFELESGIRLAAIRGRLMDQTARQTAAGGMAAVRDPKGRLELLLKDFPAISIAAWNSPEQLVISGPRQDLQVCCRRLETEGLRTRQLRVSHAFHSPVMETAAADFARAVAEEKRSAPKIPVIGNLSGKIESSRLMDPEYWRAQMLSPVLFRQSVQVLAREVDVFMEIGPRATLLPLAKRCLAHMPDRPTWIPAWDPNKGGENTAITVAAAYNAGVDVNWQAFYPGPRVVRNPGLADFPPYPFTRRILRATPPAPAGSKPAPTDSPTDSPIRLAVRSARRMEGPDAESVAALYQELDDIATLLVLAAIGRAGGLTPEHPVAERILKERLGLQPSFTALFQALCRQMADTGKIRMENQGICALLSPASARKTAETKMAAFREKFPDMAGVADLVSSCCSALPEVLSGRTDPLSLLFPGGSMEKVACVYQGQRVADYFNNLTAAGIQEAVRKLRSQQGLAEVRILEIGAGTGATTQAALAALEGERQVRYHFTDISPFFLQAAKKRFSGASLAFSAGPLDIETDPLAQGYEAGFFHIVLATGVLHATQNLDATLQHVRCLLAPGGLLFVNEPVRAFAYLTPVFGLTGGWWRGGDESGRIPDSPLIDSSNWPARLQQAGLGPVETLSLGENSPQAVFVAEVPKTGNSCQSRALSHSTVSSEEHAMHPSTICAEDQSDARHPLVEDLKKLVAAASGIPAAELRTDLCLFELGVDSLMLVQIRRQMETRFGAAPEMRQFYEETDSLEKIAGWLKEKGVGGDANNAPITDEPLDPGFQKTSPKPESPTSPGSGHRPEAAPGLPHHPGKGDMAALMTAQLDTMKSLMEKQLALMANAHQPDQSPDLPAFSGQEAASAPVSPGGRPSAAPAAPHFRLFQLAPDSLSDEQADFVADFVARFANKTQKSRAIAQNGRPVLSDWINSLGFRKTLKEIVYPAAVKSASGPRFTDVDGNDYIDMAMGYGVSFFGNNPEFIREAVNAAMANGCCMGPQTPLAATAAAGIRNLTGVERVSFCNTGSEAVMAALRIARAVTGRKTVVIFSGSYHGTFDGVLAVAGQEGEAQPATPGTLPAMVADVRLLAYGKTESLEAIREWQDDLAAVLVEPVQSRNPSLQPAEFLRELREITEKSGTALIFDEVLTGFRIHPGGCAHHFNVRPDLVTYGKILGGGMPLGVVAGKARFMDFVDGGFWYFGDGSAPKDELVTFAGTFCKHPLAMAAACAVLRRMAVEGPALQARVNRLTDELAFRINTFCKENDFALRVRHFASVFRFEPFGRYSLALNPLEPELFFRLLMDKGIYTWEKRICFLSAAHGPEEVDGIVSAVKDTLLAMREGGFSFKGRLENEAEIAPPAEPPPRTLPVLAAQKAQYAFSRIPDAEGAAHVNAAWRITGPLDTERLAAAFRDLAARHDALHLAFQSGPEGVRMAFRDKPSVAPEIVWEPEPGQDPAQAIDARLKAFIRPFDLERPPLIRMLIARLGEEDHLLALDAHHIVVDGWSLNILIQELMALYQGRIPAPAPSFAMAPPLEAAYRNSPQWEADLAFWRARLLPLPAPTDLPSRHPRPDTLDHRGEHLQLFLEADEAHELMNGARNLGVSPFVFFFSVFRLFLYRLSGRTDTVVGLPTGGRHSEEAEQMVGMFANLLPLRIAVDPGEDLAAFCKRVARESRTALDHGRMPFTDLVAHLLESRDPGRNPFYDLLFIYEDGRDREPVLENPVLENPALKNPDIRPWPIVRDSSAVDLTLEVVRGADGLHLRLEYRRALWDKADMETFAGGFLSLARQAAANKDVPLSQLGLMAREKEREVFSAWNPPPTPGDCRDLLSTINRALASGPDRPALAAGSVHMNHRELHARADELAAFLVQEQGVRPGDRVGLLCPRDSHLLIGMLAILKSGAACVPAEPGHPARRTRRVMRDAGVKVLLTGDGVDTQAFSSLPCQSLSAAKAPYGKAAPVPDAGLSPQDPAYFMYTSGSTGTPKGVAVSHESVATFCRNLPERFGMGPDTRMLAITTVTFDISVLEIHGILACGGCVVLAADSAVKNPGDILALMEKEAVTAFQSTPSYYRRLLEAEGGKDILSRRRVLLVGGEALPDDLWQQLFSLRGPAVFNVYGPTEATVWATAKKLDSASNNVGRPLVNAEMMVLTADRYRLQPPGIPGELAIGGDGVALGYVNLPEKTRAAFMSHPLAPDRKIYCTGDLGFVDAKGELHCLGRRDGQMKIRGYRVEAGEVAAVLSRQPDVVQAVVDVRRVDGNNVLCAWIRSQDPHQCQPDHAGLVDALAEELPEYMIPAFFIPVEQMPLSANGKVDVRALPDPVTRDRRSKQPDPRVLEQVMSMWRELLAKPEAGQNSNFFALGGDSIRAVRLVSALAERGFTLNVKDIFRYPTPEALAVHLCRNGNRPAAFSPAAPEPDSGDSKARLFPEEGPCLQLDAEDMAALFGETDPIEKSRDASNG